MSIFEPVVRAMAGLYQATVTEVTDGQVRPIRVSARRGLIVVPDYGEVELFNSAGTDGAANGTIRDTAPRTFSLYNNKNLMAATCRTLGFKNELNVSITVIVRYLTYVDGTTIVRDLYNESIPAGTTKALIPGAAGTGGSATGGQTWLNDAWVGYTDLCIVAASTPASGVFSAIMSWRS